MKTRMVRIGVGICLWMAVLGAQPAEVALPEGGVRLLNATANSFIFYPAFEVQAKSDVVAASGVPFASAVRLEITKVPTVPWGAQYLHNTTGDVKAGDVLLYSVWVRGGSEETENGEARAVAFLQHNGGAFEKLGTMELRAGPEWRQLLFPFRVTQGWPSGQHNFALHAGYHRQWLEFGGMQLVNYGTARTVAELPKTPLRYQGMEEDAAWRREAAERIELYRTERVRVKVVDSEGKPVVGAKVHVAMQRHAFGFGSAVTAQMLTAESADGERYREIVGKLYNRVVFENDMKWPVWEVSKTNTHGSYRRTWLETALGWLGERGIDVRGHYVCWAPVDSNDGTGGGPLETVKERLFAHIEEKLPAVAGRVVEWDAVNHIAGWGNPTLEARFGTGIFAEVFQKARALAPEGVLLWVNEGQILAGGQRRDAYERLIRQLQADGVAVDGIGFMGHFEESSAMGMNEMYRTMERFAELAPRLQLTELDVNSEDEAFQAAYLRDVMTLAFSHRAFTGIVMWGFWEGRHWKPGAALYRRDWTPKANAEVWEELVKRRWWTDVEVETDEDGQAVTRGYLGDYVVTVVAGGQRGERRMRLEKGAEAVEIAVR